MKVLITGALVALTLAGASAQAGYDCVNYKGETLFVDILAQTGNQQESNIVKLTYSQNEVHQEELLGFLGQEAGATLVADLFQPQGSFKIKTYTKPEHCNRAGCFGQSVSMVGHLMTGDLETQFTCSHAANL